MADHLAETWDGAVATLLEALKSYPQAASVPAVLPPLPHSSKPFGAAPSTMRALWDAGLVDAWDSFPAYVHASALAALGRVDDLRSRVWRAQVRALMPIIDDERGRIGKWVRDELGGQHTLPDPLEPRDLYRALQDHPHLKMWRGGHRQRLVYWLRDARNTLAHLRTLTPEDISRGRQLINRDRARS